MNIFKKTFGSKTEKVKEELKPQPKEQVDEIVLNIKTTKSNQVLNYLIENGSIDTWTAIQKFGATRLSAIIFVLRKKGYSIDTIERCVLDRNNNKCNYAKYILVQ